MDHPSSDTTGDFTALGPNPFRPRVRLDVAAQTHPGLERQNNEDQFLVAHLRRAVSVEATSLSDTEDGRRGSTGHLLLVADGMGGVDGGERASSLAVEALRGFFEEGFRSYLHGSRIDEKAVHRELRSALEFADRVILHRAAADARFERMGTTLTMAYLVGPSAHIFHAGDSRAYLYRSGRLARRTRDHTLVQALVDQGTISAEEARSHPHRNVVTNVLGGPSEGVDPAIIRIDLEDGDVLLLCSDGLTEPVDDASIAAVLGREPEPRSAVEELVAEALRRGGPDNVTVVLAVVRIES
jgi:serine/threonine protein phosphatase PrpC